MKAHKGRHIPNIETRMMRSVKLNICGKIDNHDMATPPLDIQYEREFARLMPWREIKGEFCRVQIEGLRLQEGRSRIQDIVFSRRRSKLKVTYHYLEYHKSHSFRRIS
jgi:hypothetical protein